MSSLLFFRRVGQRLSALYFRRWGWSAALPLRRRRSSWYSEKFPKIPFQSTRVERVDDTKYKVHGDLTIRDVTKPVVLDTEYEGEVNDPWGGRRAAFTATTQISRHEFGVKWNQLI